MLWIFSALCKAVWLIWNALSNTGMYTGIKSHSETDSDTEHWRTQRGKLLLWRALLLSLYAESSTAPSSSLSARLARISTKVRAKRVHSSLCGTASCRTNQQRIHQDSGGAGWLPTLAQNWGTPLRRAPTAASMAVHTEAQRCVPHPTAGAGTWEVWPRSQGTSGSFLFKDQPEGAFS